MKLPVILDLETKEVFRNVEYNRKKLGVSAIAVYDYNSKESHVFNENDIQQLFPILENASYLIGYNIRSFDIPVLQAYYPGNFSRFLIFDILDDIKDKIGKRLSLNYVLKATINKKKTGHGLQAIEYYKSGEFDKLRQYCLDDVMLTKELFEYGVEKGEIFFLNAHQKIPIKVEWKKLLTDPKRKDTHLTLPF